MCGKVLLITGLFDIADAFKTAMESKNQNISTFHARSFPKALAKKKFQNFLLSRFWDFRVFFTSFPGTRPRMTGTTLGYCPAVAPGQAPEFCVVSLIRCIAKNEFKSISSIVLELMR